MQDRKLVEGIKYLTIYSSGKRVFGLSLQKNAMRITYKGEKKYEHLYERVMDKALISKIELRNVRWSVLKKKDSKYIIMEQKNAENKRTGYLKVVEKNKARITRQGIDDYIVEANAEDWIYYVRRNGRA